MCFEELSWRHASETSLPDVNTKRAPCARLSAGIEIHTPRDFYADRVRRSSFFFPWRINSTKGLMLMARAMHSSPTTNRAPVFVIRGPFLRLINQEALRGLFNEHGVLECNFVVFQNHLLHTRDDEALKQASHFCLLIIPKYQAVLLEQFLQH